MPNPLHPAIVHFPVVLAILIPLVAIGALFAIYKGVRPMRAWGITSAVAAALALSSWVAVETGEQQEERVEDIVGERNIERHAEAGEFLMLSSLGLLAVVGVGLLPGRPGEIGRIVGTAGTIALVGGAYNVGHTGGELVYRYGAGAAYASDSLGVADGEASASGSGERGEKSEAGEKRESGEKGESSEHERGERGER